MKGDDGLVAEGPAPGFAGLLRRLRAQCGLTQEELAEAARLSPRAVSDLERGVNLTARKETARLLADALGLSGPDRSLFLAAAGGRAPPAIPAMARTGTAGPLAGPRTLPRDIAGFSGRAGELGQIMTVMAGAAAGGGVVGIHAIGGMAGVGKTTLAVHAGHQLAGWFPDGQMFVALHGHTPGQRPVDPASALADLLLAAGMPAEAIPQGQEARSACWRDHLASRKVLLVLDDAAGHEQVRPLLPGTGGSMVLITSRARLTALHDATAVSLDVLPPEEAADLLAQIAARPGITAGSGAVQEITGLCGYLPLAIGMLGSQLRHHPAWTAEDLAARLAAARDRLELMNAEDLSVAAAFGLSYRDLTAGQRRLFRALGLHPGPDIDAHAAAALAGISLATAARQLEALYTQHLITEPAAGRYRLHDLIREHARALAAADDTAVRAAATIRLLDYYLHTALAASKHIPLHTVPPGELPAARPPACAPPVSSYRQAIGWMETERANLHAAASYAAASGHLQHATLIPAAMASFLFLRNLRDESLALHQLALCAARDAGDHRAQARALLLLGPALVMTADPAAAAAAQWQALDLYRDLDDQAGQACALNSIGFLHAMSGDYPAGRPYLQQALEMYQSLGDLRGQAEVLNDLSAVHWLTGDYRSAAATAQQALDLSRDAGDPVGQVRALLNTAAAQKLTGQYAATALTLQQAMDLSSQLGDRYLQAFVLNELGIVHRLTGDCPAAITSSQQALEQFRAIGDRSGEADALTALGLVQQLTGDYRAAADNHQRALAIFRNASDRHGQAAVLNSTRRAVVPDRDAPAGPRPLHPGPGHRPRPRRAAGRGTRPGRNRPVPSP